MKNIAIIILILGVASLAYIVFDQRSEINSLKLANSRVAPVGSLDNGSKASSAVVKEISKNVERSADSEFDGLITTLPRSALRYLSFNSLSDELQLTPAFAEVSAAAPDEIEKLNAILKRATDAMTSLQEQSLVITANESDKASARISLDSATMSRLRQEMLGEAKSVVDPETYAVFSSVVDRQLGQRFYEYGSNEANIMVSRRIGANSREVFVVEQTSGSASSQGRRVVHRSEYSRDQLLAKIPLAARFKIVNPS